MKILVLSPHRGDAAFSLSLAITSWLEARHTVTILNIFTRSLQAPLSDAEFVHENDRLSYVSAMRLREDQHFVQRLTQDLPRSAKGSVKMVDLNLKDAPIRLRCPIEDVCDRPVGPDDPAIEKIRKAVERQQEAGAMDALVLPLALGEHVDHLTVRAAAMSFTTDLPSGFYEDLPYAVTHPSAGVDLVALREEASTQLNETLTPVVCGAGSAPELKRRLVAGYASQIDDDAAGLIGDFAVRYKGGERLWVNQHWLDAAKDLRLNGF